MAVRFVLGLDHLGTVSGNVVGWLGALYPSIINSVTSGSATKSSYIQAGQLGCTLSTGTDVFWFVFITTSLSTLTPTKAFWGGRCKITGTVASWVGSNAGLLWVGSPTASSLTIFAPTDLTLVGYPNLNGTNFYLEFSIDYITGQIDRWINGTQISSLFASSTVLATLQTRTLGIGMMVAVGANNQNWWRDMYWLEDTKDNTPCGRLGPQVVTPVTYTGGTAPGWSVTTGPNVYNDLNSPITSTASTLTTPVVATAGTNNLMTLTTPSGVSGLPANAAISAVTTVYAALASSNKVSVTHSTGGNSSTPDVQTPTTAMIHNYRTTPLSLAPGGAAWSNANLAALSLVVQAA